MSTRTRLTLTVLALRMPKWKTKHKRNTLPAHKCPPRLPPLLPSVRCAYAEVEDRKLENQLYLTKSFALL
ncbi:hypothetical protein NDU88_003544 [Pleurodeles waltl]|uniref:Uncharacterized protein n=1 Tax=Pleurodeles waltl TaxID=8319 RepID=A0AAV7NIE1_PLEWA|nr:hypothetical protein NDU88_003544 [Pleurodeles waltl]